MNNRIPRFTVTLLAGDGIGPEVTRSAREVLQAVSDLGLLSSAGAGDEKTGQPAAIGFRERPVGGAAFDATGTPLPGETWAACQDADAIFLGAVGGPRWDEVEPDKRPEQALLELRRRLDVFANLRPLKNARADFDVLVVRELTGGIYFGQPRGERQGSRGPEAFDTMVYSEWEVDRIARVAFEAARQRSSRVTSVDKANVLATSKLWRRVVSEVAAEFSDLQLKHQLIDSCTTRLVQSPQDFDVILTGNLFGDILSDLGGGLAGSLGILPSASLSTSGPGLYEPVHGSAPEIAGQDRANPVGAILSAAMMLRHSLGSPQAAAAVEHAVESVIQAGTVTEDLASMAPGTQAVGTQAFSGAVVDQLQRAAATRSGTPVNERSPASAS